METLNIELLKCKDNDTLVSKLKDYAETLQTLTISDVSAVFESLSLMIDIYKQTDFDTCEGLTYVNNILIILLREHIDMCVHCEKDLLINLKNYLLLIIRQEENTICNSLRISAIRLLAILCTKNILSKEEKRETLFKLKKIEHDLFTRFPRQDNIALFAIIIATVSIIPALIRISSNIYIEVGIVIVFCIVFFLSCYLFYCHKINGFNKSVIPLNKIEECTKQHIHFMSLFTDKTVQPIQHYTIDTNKPAQVQVGDRVFNSGEEAIRIISEELRNTVRKSLQEEKANKQEDSKPQSTSSDLKPMTALERQAQQVIDKGIQQPIPIPQNLRENLVKLGEILEANGKNPDLLKAVKEDIEFFDNVVIKKSVSYVYLQNILMYNSP